MQGQTLSMYIVPKVKNPVKSWERADWLYMRDILFGYFRKVLRLGGPFSNPRVVVGAIPGAVQPTDLVCYVLTDPKDSILMEINAIGPFSDGGGTWWKPGRYMTSEVYFNSAYKTFPDQYTGQPILASDDARKHIANMIFHELMHNKLDASDPVVTSDIHTIPGGSLSRGKLNSSFDISDADAAWMHRGIERSNPQNRGYADSISWGIA